ncbi:DNA mismatch repair protein Msh6-like [Lineus longissimus]|uniref:DNA mismatch repair protein Msh6-like n=1 Tax=Lineus longissimus TaxID=88925 RepID=UPI002B4E9D4E
MSQQKSLFSFFSPKSKTELATNNNNNVVEAKGHTTPPKPKQPECGFQVGDLVWAKLEGYPWWASMVCNHPTKEIFHQPGIRPEIHVQFFDDPPTRGWVQSKYVKPFVGLDNIDCRAGGLFFCRDQQQQTGATECNNAMAMSREDRLAMVLDILSEDEEEEEDMEVEKMEFDKDLFDDEADSDADNSKENREESPKKTPGKTPRKNGRPTRPKAKRRKILVESGGEDDSADEFKVEPGEEQSESDDSSSGVDENEVSDMEGSDTESPRKKTGKRKRDGKGSVSTPNKPTESLKKFFTPVSSGKSSVATPVANNETKPLTNGNSSAASTPTMKSTPVTPVVNSATKSKLAAFSAPNSSPNPTAVGEDDSGIVYTHYTLDFIKPDKLKDAKGRPKGHEDYDPKTLLVSGDFLRGLTPAMRQWWELKSQHFDTVLFFKVGKFYELYHMDAVTAVNELGLIYMKGNHAHSGFPEIAYGRYADILVQKGYKVARIEQTESVDAMQERCKQKKNSTKFDKVVRREICRITTKGTKTYSFIDGNPSDNQNAYLLSVVEKSHDDTSGGGCMYGVCFIDTSIGKFHIGQFEDDRHCSRFRTLVAHFTPVQVIYEKGKLSQKTWTFINSNLISVIKEQLTPKEFWDGSKTLKCLSEEKYFQDEEKAGEFEWPSALKKMISDSDTLGHTPGDNYQLAMNALGGIVSYLRMSYLDIELLSMKNFEEYVPIDRASASKVKSSVFRSGQHMVLDGVTLANLEVVANSTTGTREGTLIDRLDQCSTPFGRRLFKQWLCTPLCNPYAINERLDAVEDLMNNQDVVSEVTDILKKLPDLERLLSKIHTLGSATRSKEHPDGRAVFFEDLKYSKRKIEDFLDTLNGFKLSLQAMKLFKKCVTSFKSKLLKQTVGIKTSSNSEGRFPDISGDLQFFDDSFDHNKARQDGKILPNHGVDPEYDGALVEISTAKVELDDYLKKQKQRLGCKTLTYWGSGKNRFQIEVPDSVSKNVPHQYELKSQKKGYKRYWTDDIEDLFSVMTTAEDRRDVALRDVMRRIFYAFDKKYKMWETVIQCLSVLDVLINLSAYSRCGDGMMCRPDVISPDEDTRPFIEIREGRHPCISRTFSGGDFIPNDTVVGTKDENDEDTKGNTDSSVVLVTGPNMGGKSTLMRQVGLIVITAQLGCYVPAEKCCLTPVDRVFTRLGASDRIMAGESTFFVELSETSAILQHATQHSLVLMDELGRGTATYDGTAIACAVVNELSQNIRCRTLFSTHYHSLVEEFSHDPNIRCGHMACMVENENEEDPSQETITFLYKFIKGECPKSYGFNAARLADLPEEVIAVARRKAKEFEEAQNRMKVFRMLRKLKEFSADNIKNLQNQICVA